MSEKREKQSVWDRVPFLQKLKNVKHIEIIVIAIFITILALIFLSSQAKKSGSTAQISEFNLEVYTKNLENRLSLVLGEINGAGKVSVMVTLDGGISYEYAKESEEVTTTSAITNGTNTKTTTSESVVIVTQNGKSTPLIVREIYPEVSGVVVVSSGAGNVAVKLNIINAVSTLLGVSENQIQVLVGSK